MVQFVVNCGMGGPDLTMIPTKDSDDAGGLSPVPDDANPPGMPTLLCGKIGECENYICPFHGGVAFTSNPDDEGWGPEPLDPEREDYERVFEIMESVEVEGEEEEEEGPTDPAQSPYGENPFDQDPYGGIEPQDSPYEEPIDVDFEVKENPGEGPADMGFGEEVVATVAAEAREVFQNLAGAAASSFTKHGTESLGNLISSSLENLFRRKPPPQPGDQGDLIITDGGQG